jgi:putative membrane-bound dehydrogenase-like protein
MPSTSLGVLNRISVLLAICVLRVPIVIGQEALPLDTINFADQLPRIPASSPEESLAAIATLPGYRVELAASEPAVLDPIAVAFDDAARMYVVEMCDYSEQADESLGNVRLLEDRDHDGFFETSTLFADGLSWPTAVVCYDGGVFVGAAPDIWFLKDTDDDGRADVRRKVLTGFGRENVQGLLNSFTWGLDSRIYCQTSSSSSRITIVDRPEKPAIDLSGRDFSFDPHSMDLRTETGGGQHGMSFDDWGNRFTCHNSDHLQWIAVDDRYQRITNMMPFPASRLSIAADGPQASVYRISQVEPWRVLRTHLRIAGKTAGWNEGGGRASGFFTSATGVTIYRGDAMPELHGMAFVGDVGSNLVHRKKLGYDGFVPSGVRIDDGIEFLASKDIWFRPVQFASAPDGALYVLDMYREVIEHPKSLPTQIKQHLDLTSGRDRGRIYRIVPEKGSVRRNNDLRDMTISQWIDMLGHSNAWHRETSARRIVEMHHSQGTPSAVALAIEDLAQTMKNESGKLQCLGVLAALRQVPRDLSIWCSHPNPWVRARAVSLLEPLSSESTRIQSVLSALGLDSSEQVQYAVACCLISIPFETKERNGALRSLLCSKGTSAYLTTAVANASSSSIVSIVHHFIESDDPQFSMDALERLGRIYGLRADRSSLEYLDQHLLSSTATDRMLRIGLGCVACLSETGDPTVDRFPNLPNLQRILVQEMDRASQTLESQESSESEKIAAIHSLGWQMSPTNTNRLMDLVNPRESLPVQLASLQQLSRSNDPAIADGLLHRYAALSPALRQQVFEVCLRRKSWIDRILEMASPQNDRPFRLRELDASQQARLLQYPDGVIRERVQELLGAKISTDRQQVIERYREAIRGTGDVTEGRQVFAKACAACHRLEGVGIELGPNLVSFKYRGAQAILENILDPNRETNPRYISYNVLTTDQRVLTGMSESESDAAVTLVAGNNSRVTIPRSEIETMSSSGVSIMPVGLEGQIDLQAMADLIAYLVDAK